MKQLEGIHKSIVSLLVGFLIANGIYFATPLYNEDHGRAALYSLFYNQGAVITFGIIITAVGLFMLYSMLDVVTHSRMFSLSMFASFLCCTYMLVSLIIAPSPPGAQIVITRYALHLLPILLSAIYWVWFKNYVKRPSG